MTQNDQAAMNEQLTELRLNGLSIDGDNRYKQDLIDAVIGAMMFGAQGANPPPSGHWLEQFYVIAREERQALARVEAAYANRLRNVKQLESERDTAQAQLAEAVGLLRYSQEIARLFDDEHTAEVGRFLSRHVQAEQQEAQGAQAGDLASAVRVLLEVPQLQGEQAFSAQPIIDRVRAALATQPAAGEPKPIGYISEAVHQELLNGKHVPANICTATPSRRNPHPGPDANWSVPIFAAPPAPPHGDEAVRKDAEAAYIEMTCQPVLIDGAHHYYLSSERMQAFDRLFSVDVSDAAMRAQGAGEVK